MKQKIYVVDDIVNMRAIGIILRNVKESCFEEYVSYNNNNYIVSKDFNNDKFIVLEEKEYCGIKVNCVPQRKKLDYRSINKSRI
jgi:hypothetical protein